MAAVNDTLQREVSGSEESGPSARGHTNVCLLCGGSTLHRQSDSILRQNPTEMQQSIINIIESKVTPREISSSDRVCHACWLRTKREDLHMNCQDESRPYEYNLRGSGDTTLIRAKIKSRHVSRRQYYVYLIIENNVPGRAGIVGYCCSCLVGKRSVGCCAPTMTVVWYLGWARHQPNITAPAGFLDDIVVREDEE